MTSSLLAARRGSQTPRVSRYPTYVRSEAEDAVDLAAATGLELDEWQRYVLQHGLGKTAEERWSASRVGCWVPRQNGKGGIIEALELYWLFCSREKLILHSAHEYKTAQEAFLRIRDLIQGCPDLDKLVNRYWQANGEQGVELTRAAGGSRLRFVARSRSSGRGFSGDKNILDEAQYLIEAMMAALQPTLSARPDPQLWFFGTPPEEPDAWVYGLRQAGESGAPRLAWFDWGADLDVTKPETKLRYADRTLWFGTNPAAGIRIREETIEDECGPSGLGSKFPHERLGVWLPFAGEGGGVLDPQLWAAMLDPESKRSGHLALALDMTPMRDHGSIGMYGPRADELEHMQLVDYREGVDWMVARAAELKVALDPICFVVDGKNGAAALIPELAAVGICVPEDPEQPKRGDLLVLGTSEVADAVGQFIDGFRVNPPRYRHIGQEPLDTAIKNVKARPIGDAGQIAWGRKLSEVDIGPVQSVTEARYGYHAWVDLVTRDYDLLDSVW